MPTTGSSTESPAHHPRGVGGRIALLARRARDRSVLGLHRMADRFDLVPPEFGREQPVDEADAGAVMTEWSRYFRLWADYNPEEIFALKVGAALLLAAIIALWLLIAIFF